MATIAAVLLTLAIVAAGVVAGTWVLVSAVIVPGRRLLSHAVNEQVHRAFDPRFHYVPPLAAMSIVAGVAAAVVGHDSRPSLVLSAVGAGAMAVGVAISLRVNVPRNPHYPELLAQEPPLSYDDLYGVWDTANLARTAVALVGLSCYALAAGML